MKKWVYLFSEGKADMRNLLGGKGANLAEMTNLGLPVPQGFTITTEACTQYYEDGREINDEIMGQINEHIVNAAYIDFTVSLLIDCDIEDKTLLKAIKKKINTMRIAGGDIVNIKEVTIEDNSNKIKEKLGGGFILFDKNNDINKYEGKDNLDKMITACNTADYIPLAVGFRALTECSNSIENVRDNDTPSTFVEQLYGLGKFESIKDIDSFNSLFWRYKYEDKLYICTQYLKGIAEAA